jgi:hypothetical protein
LAETVTSFTDQVVRAKISSLGGAEMGFRQRLIRVYGYDVEFRV